jgi:3',5'-cyclic AMP phosphodiesterase CpdA
MTFRSIKTALVSTSILFALSLAMAGCAGKPDTGDRPVLRFRADGTFTILQITDTHLHYPDKRDPPTYALIRRVVRQENPDLLYLTGDIARWTDEPDSMQTWPRLVPFLDSLGVPWAFVYGNHDPEVVGYRQIDSMLATSPLSMYELGLDSIRGHGNYVLTILSHSTGEPGAFLWGFDSGYDGKGVYDWLRKGQLDWFTTEHARLHAGLSKPVTDLAFMHIPIPQYDSVWNTKACRGVKFEKVCMQGRETGQFDTLKGRVVAMFCGHDHVNDYTGTLDGLDLVYGRATGYRAYGKDKLPRGARVIRLTEGERGYHSHIRVDDGSIADLPLHTPETAK